VVEDRLGSRKRVAEIKEGLSTGLRRALGRAKMHHFFAQRIVRRLTAGGLIRVRHNYECKIRDVRFISIKLYAAKAATMCLIFDRSSSSNCVFLILPVEINSNLYGR
jgi:hypothetical protein